jgi:hypothetical protein
MIGHQDEVDAIPDRQRLNAVQQAAQGGIDACRGAVELR